MALIETNVERAVLDKYKNDLDFLIHGRDQIIQQLKHDNIEDDVINKKLSKLNKSIAHLSSLIEEYESSDKSSNVPK